MNAPKLANTLEELAERSGINRTAIYEQIRKGIGPRTFKIGRRVLVSEADAVAWIAGLAEAGAGRSQAAANSTVADGAL